MTGWRLGWLVLPDDLVGPVSALAGNLALCPPTLSQHAALAAFDDDGMAAARAATARYARCRDLLLAAKDRLRWDPVAPADGAFYLYGDLTFTRLDSVTYCERLLDEAGIARRKELPGPAFEANAERHGPDIKCIACENDGVVAKALKTFGQQGCGKGALSSPRGTGKKDARAVIVPAYSRGMKRAEVEAFLNRQLNQPILKHGDDFFPSAPFPDHSFLMDERP